MSNTLNQVEKPYLSIRPTSGWQALNVSELWQFRDLLLTLAVRDVKLRYRQTALGVLWVIAQPLLAAGIFTFVFGRVAKLPSDGIPYFVFAYAGLLGWTAFSNTVAKASNCMIQNSHLVSKVFFPRLVLPLATVVSALIDFGVALGMMIVLMVIHHIHPHLGLLLLPLWLALLVMLAIGIGLYAAALTVSYRDVQYIMPVFLQMLLYASPVPYAVSAVPVSLRPIYFLNPLSGLLEAFRWSLLGRGHVSWEHVAYAVAVTVIVFVAGAYAFKKMERRFADVI